MINQKQAFNRFTTAKHTLEVYVEGHYDNLNNWVADSWLPPIPIACTALPYGDRDSGVSGQQLKATDVGERQPEFQQIHSRTEMPMKSILTLGKSRRRLKVMEVSDISDAGFYRVIAAKLLEK